MLATLAALILMSPAEPPAPCLPVPTPRQMAWHRMETYAFVHFGPNTFTNREWGEGIEDPKVFAPTELNCEQWVKAFKDAGFKMVILTAKHHDGFCLWPSKQSTHTVAASGYNGDVLAEVSKAAKKIGLKLGVYLSPWDRNHPNYGTDAYNDTFVNCLTEVLSNYGNVSEVWFDGANGEGPNGKKQVYDWPRFHETVRKLQPDACMFSDAGPDVRWVGNESGFAAETDWAMIPSGRYVPGTPLSKELTEGNEKGDLYVPAECDVSIRPGWFYHAAEDTKVKSVSQLVDLYFRSVGQNANFLLNVPPDRRGLLHDNDVHSLVGFGKWRTATFSKDLARGAKATADVTRGKGFEASRVVDGKDDTYWAAPDDAVQASVTLNFKRKTFDVISLQEFVELGQRVRAFSLEANVEGNWVEIGGGTTIGYKRLIRLPTTMVATGLRLNILDARACPTIRSIGLFASPDIHKREIQARVARDQEERSKINWSKPDLAAVKRLEVVDLTNLVYLKELFKQQGWLGSSMIGEDGAHDLWLLTQHMDMDPDFQEQCLGAMEKAVAEHEATGTDFAYLTDRVLRARKKPQRYGTQLAPTRDGRLSIQDCEDMTGLDRRRQALGMEPIADYVKFCERFYNPQTHDIAELLSNGWKEVKMSDDGSFDMTGKIAKVEGGKAVFEDSTDSVGFWTDLGSTLGWVIEVPSRRVHHLKLQYACEPGSEGSSVIVSIGSETKTFTVLPTKSWFDFAWADLGTVTLEPGLLKVTVKATTMPGGAVMNLKNLRLEK